MNPAIVMGILRAVVPAAVTYAVGRGWISASSAGEIGAAIITLGAAAWSAVNNTQQAKIAAVVAMPEVAGVVTKPTLEGRALAEATPALEVVTAGTPAAASIAK